MSEHGRRLNIFMKARPFCRRSTRRTWLTMSCFSVLLGTSCGYPLLFRIEMKGMVIAAVLIGVNIYLMSCLCAC